MLYINQTHIMDRFFVEEETDGNYRIAMFDKHKIFLANNPGKLANVFECSMTNPTRADDAQIFYALAPMIGANDFCVDLQEKHRSYHLNNWSIITTNSNIDNLFLSVSPLNLEERMRLYSVKHSITPSETLVSNSDSLFALTEFAGKLSWKTGVLMRCIDRLVLPQYRGDPKVYATIDKEYRRLMRFKIEIEGDGSFDSVKAHSTPIIFNLVMKFILIKLGLKNSHDTQTIFNLPDLVGELDNMAMLVPAIRSTASTEDRLRQLLKMWSGAILTELPDPSTMKSGAVNLKPKRFKIEVEPDVIIGLSYMQPFLHFPTHLSIIDDPL
jgi:hypothetical protein